MQTIQDKVQTNQGKVQTKQGKVLRLARTLMMEGGSVGGREEGDRMGGRAE